MRTVFAFTASLALATGSRLSTRGATPAAQQAIDRYDPARDLGPLFREVQLSGIFPDSKTFVDARPRVPLADIVTSFASRHSASTFNLRAFVAQDFELPRPAGKGYRVDTTPSMEEHIRALWSVLTRPADTADARSSLIPLPRPYVVPGGRFREVYY